jgi:hypothetical protein
VNASRARQPRKEGYNGRPKNDRRYAVGVTDGKAMKFLHFFFPERTVLFNKGQIVCIGLRAKYKKLKKEWKEFHR